MDGLSSSEIATLLQVTAGSRQNHFNPTNAKVTFIRSTEGHKDF